MTVTAPPRPPTFGDRQDHQAREALIEEARRHARRRRRRNGACAVVVIVAGAAAFLGFGQRGGGGTAALPAAPASAGAPAWQGQVETGVAGHFVVITLRGHVAAARTLHSAGGPVHYREAGSYRVVWRVPASALRRGRSFRSTSAIVTGTTSAVFDTSAANSCRGTLTARRKPFELRVVDTGYSSYLSSSTIGLIASPSPIATATAAACPRGLLASHWRLSPDRSHVPYRHTSKRRKDWWIYNHPGFGFYGKRFTPYPKGGDSEGWIQGWGTAGSFTWLAILSLRRAA